MTVQTLKAVQLEDEQEGLIENVNKKNSEKIKYPTKMELYQFENRFLELFDISAQLTFNSKMTYLHQNMLVEQKCSTRDQNFMLIF